jgi:hypothetical protein
MKAEEKLLCTYMGKFFEDNFSKITYDLLDSNLPTQKRKFIAKIMKDSQTAVWSLSELANWGMNKEYLRELYVELPDECDFTILKIDDKYLKLTCDKEYNYHLNFSEPKIKTVIYFD